MKTDPTSLDQLHDIITPPPPSWFPPAPGWYWLAGFLFLLSFIGALAWFRRWQQNRYRRDALTEWRQIAQLLGSPEKNTVALTNLASLLKRTALSAFPREDVASLTGPAWFRFLDQTSAKITTFSSSNGQVLENVSYDPRTAATVDKNQANEIAEQVRTWIKRHQVDPSRRSDHNSSSSGPRPVPARKDLETPC